MLETHNDPEVIIRSVLEYANPAWAGLTQYLSGQIE